MALHFQPRNLMCTNVLKFSITNALKNSNGALMYSMNIYISSSKDTANEFFDFEELRHYKQRGIANL